jgi:leader peptidase (prepilin peptidase)/N-methyltransferase
MIRVLGTVFAALLGLAFGSFLNVCLSRWPQGESIVTPRSHCRTCGRTLAWWENVPLASWLVLRGRCRGCGAWIGWRYVIIEAAMASLFALEAWKNLPPVLDPLIPLVVFSIQLVSIFLNFIFIWLMVALAALDAEHLWLPDWLTIPGIALGLSLGLLKLPLLIRLSAATGLPLAKLAGSGVFSPALELIAGVLAAAALILLIRWVYWLVRRREGIGLGDAKLMALLAAWLGFPGAVLAFGIGVVLGALLALLVLLAPARESTNRWGLLKLPLGTFLCIGGIVSGLWGHQMIWAYLRWAGF